MTVIDCVVAPPGDHKYAVPAFAVRVTLPPVQNVVGPEAVIVAVAEVTVTVCDALAEQPFVSVTCTEYVVVAAGVTVIDDVVAPFDQRNEVPPLAVSVAVDPAQIALGPLIVAAGSALTETAVGTDVALQLPFATVTL